MKTPRIIIEVHGGVVQMVYSEIECKVAILDHDNAESGDMEEEERTEYEALCEEVKSLPVVY